MANNRLYIYDPEEREAFLLATSSGAGWCPNSRYEIDDVTARLRQWFEFRDYGASYSNCPKKTVLILCDEHDLPKDVLLNQIGDDRFKPKPGTELVSPTELP